MITNTSCGNILTNGDFVYDLNETTLKIVESQMTILDLSDTTITHLECPSCGLKTLIVPESLKYIDCCFNQLEELILPPGTEEAHCSFNKLTKLRLPKTSSGTCVENPLDKFDWYEDINFKRELFNQSKKMLLDLEKENNALKQYRIGK
ncbi:hypothetical protein GEMRC1_005905 [Eukaryota sp. GEM-RC1]